MVLGTIVEFSLFVAGSPFDKEKDEESLLFS